MQITKPHGTKSNARVKFFPDDNGKWVPKSITVFDKPTFVLDGFESKKWDVCMDDDEVDSGDGVNDFENQRKSYGRAKNNLFDVLMATPQFDTFVTLTLDKNVVNRTNYSDVVKRLGVWLDNRVRRNNLTYVLVPEFHSDGVSVHFHGLMTWDSLNLVRAVNQDKKSKYFGQPLCDNEQRPVYNIKDYKLGFSTAIRVTGENGREACAKYCFKYITKTNGVKVGGRYYLSGGNLGRPKFELLDVFFNAIDGYVHETDYTTFKRVNFESDTMPEALKRYYNEQTKNS